MPGKSSCRARLAGRLPCSESGQSMAEFLIILPVMLLLIFGAIQFALIFHAKITLNYAAFEAVRYGSLGEGQFAEVQEGFIRGLAPLYSYFESDGKTDSGMQIQAFQKARDCVYSLMYPVESSCKPNSSVFVRIERLNPADAAFLDFAPDMQIPNDTLRYRSSAVQGNSKSSIQDANLLHLRITYWYPLYVPFVNSLIYKTFICCKTPGIKDAFCKWSDDPICQDDSQTPVIPLTATAVMRMQTPLKKSLGYFNEK